MSKKASTATNASPGRKPAAVGAGIGAKLAAMGKSDNIKFFQ